MLKKKKATPSFYQLLLFVMFLTTMAFAAENQYSSRSESIASKMANYLDIGQALKNAHSLVLLIPSFFVYRAFTHNRMDSTVMQWVVEDAPSDTRG